jgi:hypothetical protein
MGLLSTDKEAELPYISAGGLSMNLRTVLFGLAVLAALSNVAILIMIMVALNRLGYKTNMLLARIYTFKYLSAYKEVTLKETGRPGRLYGLWIFTINLALVAALAGFLVPRA